MQKLTTKQLMQKIDGKQVIIVGLRGSGKSYLIDQLAHENLKHIFIDPLDEHTQHTRFVPSRRMRSPQLQTEISTFFNKLKTNQKIKLIFCDEANQYFINKWQPLPDEVQDLVDYSRHDKKTICWVARRITQLPTDITELGDIYIFFKQTGKNDLRALDDISAGLKEIMQKEIRSEQHNFILFDGSETGVYKI
jgi:superfamily I DNA and RNA helicase